MSTNERAQAIRKELRAELGATSRDISVRSDKYSMGATIHVMIKSADYSLDAVRKIAESHANVRRCEITGDILCGGNTHISVDYTAEALAPMVEKLQAELSSVKGIGETVKIRGLTCFNCPSGHNGYGGPDYWTAIDANGGEVIFTYGLQSIVRQLAEKFCSGYTAPEQRPALRLVTEPTTNAQVEFLAHLGAI